MCLRDPQLVACGCSVSSGGWKSHTRITLPVKVVIGVAVALQRFPQLLARWAVCERHVVVGDVVEEVDLLLGKHERGSNRVHWRIAPALVEEPAVLVQALKEVEIRLGAEPAEATDLEIGPLRRDCQQGKTVESLGNREGGVQSGRDCTSCRRHR